MSPETKTVFRELAEKEKEGAVKHVDSGRGPHTIHMSDGLWRLLERLSAAEGCRPVHLIEELIRLHYGPRHDLQRGFDPDHVMPLMGVALNRLAAGSEKAIARRILRDHYGIVLVGSEKNDWVSSELGNQVVDHLRRHDVEEALDEGRA